MQETLYDISGRNTRNPNSPTDLRPAYWDNPYWVGHENYQTGYKQTVLLVICRLIGELMITLA